MIRPYTPLDKTSCLAVFDTNVPRFFRDHERPEFAAFLDDLPGPYLVLGDDDARIVACGGLAVVSEERRADLCWGMVRAELHGTGLGRRLTEARIDAAAQRPEVDVVALNTSQLTRGFYERLGFETVEVVPDGYAPGLDRCELRLWVGPGDPPDGRAP